MMQDFGQATGQDAMADKAAMPKVMQVKKFGFRSQVKWTHLTAEDTSRPEGNEPMWAQDKRINEKVKRMQGGIKGAADFDRPAAKRKKR